MLQIQVSNAFTVGIRPVNGPPFYLYLSRIGLRALDINQNDSVEQFIRHNTAIEQAA